MKGLDLASILMMSGGENPSGMTAYPRGLGHTSMDGAAPKGEFKAFLRNHTTSDGSVTIKTLLSRLSTGFKELISRSEIDPNLLSEAERDFLAWLIEEMDGFSIEDGRVSHAAAFDDLAILRGDNVGDGADGHSEKKSDEVISTLNLLTGDRTPINEDHFQAPFKEGAKRNAAGISDQVNGQWQTDLKGKHKGSDDPGTEGVTYLLRAVKRQGIVKSGHFNTGSNSPVPPEETRLNKLDGDRLKVQRDGSARPSKFTISTSEVGLKAMLNQLGLNTSHAGGPERREHELAKDLTPVKDLISRLFKQINEKYSHDVQLERMDFQGLKDVLRALSMLDGNKDATDASKQPGATKPDLTLSYPRGLQHLQQENKALVLSPKMGGASLTAPDAGTDVFSGEIKFFSKGSEKKEIDPVNTLKRAGAHEAPFDPARPLDKQNKGGEEPLSQNHDHQHHANRDGETGPTMTLDNTKVKIISPKNELYGSKMDGDDFWGIFSQDTQGIKRGPVSTHNNPMQVMTPHILKEAEEGILNFVAKNVTNALKTGEHLVKMRLHPPELGMIRAELRVDATDNVVRATFLADVKDIRGLLEQHHHLLRETLMQHGYRLHDFSVQSLTSDANLDNSLGWFGGAGNGHHKGTNARGDAPWRQGHVLTSRDKDRQDDPISTSQASITNAGLSIRV